MFYYCTNLEDIGNMDDAWFTARTPAQSMFAGDIKIITPITYSQIPSGWK
jgi:hypothetical protein